MLQKRYVWLQAGLLILLVFAMSGCRGSAGGGAGRTGSYGRSPRRSRSGAGWDGRVGCRSPGRG